MPIYRKNGLRRSLTELIGGILQQEAPEEAGAFQIVGEAVVADLLVGKRPSRVDDGGFDFGALEGGLLVLNLVAGTLSVIEIVSVRSKLKMEKEATTHIKKIWQSALIENGLNKELAERIPIKFGSELERIIGEYQHSKKSKESEPDLDIPNTDTLTITRAKTEGDGNKGVK